MKRLVLIAILILSMVSASDCCAAPQKPGERQQWMEEMRQYKRNYFNKELELTREQQNRFYPLYEEMEGQIEKIKGEARAMEKRVGEMKDPSDLEYSKATEAVYDSEIKCSQIEREYIDKFSSILSAKQLFRLKAVERSFNRELMKQHHRLRFKARQQQQQQ